MYEPGGFKWWWPHMKSERAARLIEAYWAPVNGDRSIIMLDEHKDERGLTLARRQVRHIKTTLERLGYRLIFRVREGKIVGWVSPIRQNPVKPPPAEKRRRTRKPKPESPIPHP